MGGNSASGRPTYRDIQQHVPMRVNHLAVVVKQANVQYCISHTVLQERVNNFTHFMKLEVEFIGATSKVPLHSLHTVWFVFPGFLRQGSLQYEELFLHLGSSLCSAASCRKPRCSHTSPTWWWTCLRSVSQPPEWRWRPQCEPVWAGSGRPASAQAHL